MQLHHFSIAGFSALALASAAARKDTSALYANAKSENQLKLAKLVGNTDTIKPETPRTTQRATTVVTTVTTTEFDASLTTTVATTVIVTRSENEKKNKNTDVARDAGSPTTTGLNMYFGGDLYIEPVDAYTPNQDHHDYKGDASGETAAKKPAAQSLAQSVQPTDQRKAVQSIGALETSFSVGPSATSDPGSESASSPGSSSADGTAGSTTLATSSVPNTTQPAFVWHTGAENITGSVTTCDECEAETGTANSSSSSVAQLPDGDLDLDTSNGSGSTGIRGQTVLAGLAIVLVMIGMM